MPPKVLGQIFDAIRQPDNPNTLLGFETSDDGGVFRLGPDSALVQSIDFFTPIVDDPADFGAVSAANALSDIYAMGGRPISALCMVCFPYRDLDTAILSQIVAGGSEKITESGAALLGGHSVGDDEIKFGYAVTGLVHPDQFWRNNTPLAGDRLVLTKPLGTGLMTTAVKQDKCAPHFLEQPLIEMRRLNRAAAESARELPVHAATDITGFGLLGHLYEMLRSTGLGASLRVENLPLFPGVWQAIKAKALTAAHDTNKEYLAAYSLIDNPCLTRFEAVLFDPQTSGGLLFSLPQVEAEYLVDQLTAQGHHAAQIGSVETGGEIRCI